MSDDVAEIKKRLDIVEYIGAYTPLKRAGRYFASRCPFPDHNDKSPSFTVSPDRQSFMCYGCRKHGDIFSFAMEYHGVDFKEALSMLADQAGIVLQRKTNPNKKQQDNKIETALKTAMDYFRFHMKSNSGKAARDYMLQRGFTEAYLDRFEIGWAPDQWDGLVQYAAHKGVHNKDLEKACLSRPRKGGSGHFDFFRGRVMFPIRTPRGDLCGFGGRILDGDGPKYLNTGETDVFKKGELLYGMHLAKELFSQQRYIMIMEGYTDVMMVQQKKLGPATALLGAEVTEPQARYLKRFSAPVYFVCDTDSAGLNAAMRSLKWFLKYGIDARISMLPEGKDPCEFLADKEEPEEIWQSSLKQSQPVFQFKLDQLLKEESGPLEIESKVRIAKHLIDDLVHCDESLRQAAYLRDLSQKLNLPEENLKEVLLNHPSKKKAETQPRPKPKAPTQTQPLPKNLEIRKDTCYFLIALLLDDPQRLAEVEEQLAQVTDLHSPNAQLLKKWIEAHTSRQSLAIPELQDILDPLENEILSTAMREELPKTPSSDQMFKEKLRELFDPKLQMSELRVLIKSAEQNGDHQKAGELMKAMQELLKRKN